MTLDADAVAAVIDNLLDNAIKYSPPGGHIQVQMTHAPANASLVLSIQDEGPGIASQDLATAFERFVRLHTDSTDSLAGGSDDLAAYPAGGAGLGLSIVQRAADRLGARVRLTLATKHRGLRAELILPVT